MLALEHDATRKTQSVLMHLCDPEAVALTIEKKPFAHPVNVGSAKVVLCCC